MTRFVDEERIKDALRDEQEIKLLVTDDGDGFKDYISLLNRSTGEELNLSNNGAILSERLAKLLDVKKGDVITVTDSGNHQRDITVSDIGEMYTGHYIFMSTEYYETVFGEKFDPNANLVILNDRSIENANSQASEFINLDGVKGVVQNTTLINQIYTIVLSLNNIMQIKVYCTALPERFSRHLSFLAMQRMRPSPASSVPVT